MFLHLIGILQQPNIYFDWAIFRDKSKLYNNVKQQKSKNIFLPTNLIL